MDIKIEKLIDKYNRKAEDLEELAMEENDFKKKMELLEKSNMYFRFTLELESILDEES